MRQLLDAGISVSGLKAEQNWAVALERLTRELPALSISAPRLRQAGFTANELRDAGCEIRDLVEAGSSIDELKVAKVTAENLERAGCREEAREMIANRSGKPC